MNTTEIEHELINAKAIAPVIIDVRHLTTITDSIIVCSASSTRHAQTLSDKITRIGKKNGLKEIHVEGQEQGDWILVEIGDCIVHIFTEEKREYYDIEKLWSIRPNDEKEI